ncbi:MAG: hypothetical protein HYZ14_11740 [Bacteroidetes bacterium]|nr:hypothetical protein [Bacteroidota bacterium]
MNKILLFLTLAVAVSCKKKEPTTWQTDWAAPVAHGHLTLSDLIPAEYTTLNAENYVSIVYHKPVYTFTIDTIVDLPDTNIVKKSAVAFSSLNVNPGFSYTDTYDQEYLLDQIELKKVQIESGTLEVLIKCPWPGASLVTFTFPKITNGSSVFERTYAMPAASLSNPAIAQETVNISDFMIDLTGTSGDLINMFSAIFEMGSNETTDSYVVTDADSIEYVISFKDLKPNYAKGYFGQYYFSDTVGISLDFMKNIVSGQIDVDSIDMTLTLKNGFNLIAQSKITQVLGLNTKTANTVGLAFPMLNTSMNINPASGGFYDYVPSEFPIPINNTNSNVTGFIENMSDSILLGYELEINPYGNVTAGSDEIFPGSALELFLDAEFPLEFGADALTLVDTFEIAYDNSESVYPENGEFILTYSNGFPLEATAFFQLLDANGNVIDLIESSQPVYSGTYNNVSYLTAPATGELTFSLTSENVVNLDMATHVILNVAFSTDQAQKVKIGSDAWFDFTLKSNLKVNVEL